ncbi:acyl-CoA N-acyltransferase [Pterulicium gracile]|uniref:Acyl-CoA N-acyltransferase n=1 Tax=Pterulicium gracile TaxID=1884261 RepID=A0A5C3Q7J1_9AGAR|nr:acyl-CoA N-acyltransferase [Pterula gracilis]
MRKPVAPSTLSQAKTLVEKIFEPAFFHAIITLRSSSDTFIGYTVLAQPQVTKNRDAKYSVALLPEYQGHGYGTEVTRFIVDWGFRMGGLHRVWLGVFATNVGAIKVYEKCGFKKHGQWRKEHWVNGEWVDGVLMAIVDEDWEKEQAALEQK